MSVMVCSQPGCPAVVPRVPRGRRRCDTHQRQAEQARGTTEQRGYGAAHRHKARARAIAQATPATPCARCGQPLGDAYRSAHLDHTDDRQGYLGLSHAACNLSAAGKASHR